MREGEGRGELEGKRERDRGRDGAGRRGKGAGRIVEGERGREGEVRSLGTRQTEKENEERSRKESGSGSEKDTEWRTGRNGALLAHVGSIPRGKHFFSRCSTSCVMVVAYFTSAHSRMCWKRYSHCNSRLCSLAILRAKLAGTMSTVRGRRLSTRLILAEA